MTVYVDEIRHYPRARWERKDWCHMVTDGQLAELHRMARTLGVRRRLHEHRVLPHYDLTPPEREQALRLGAVAVGRHEMVALLRRTRERPLIDAYLDGVHSVTTLGSRFHGRWSLPTPCTQWDAQTLAAHLHATAKRHVELLESRVASTVIVGDDLAARNAAAIAALSPLTGPEHLGAFGNLAALALRTIQRTPDAVVHRWPDGHAMTARDLASVGVVEWHVHAWDLAQAIGESYEPGSAGAVAQAWRAAIRHIPLPEGDPWTGVLLASGRAPVGWSDDTSEHAPA